jgi:hypothetical protein
MPNRNGIEVNMIKQSKLIHYGQNKIREEFKDRQKKDISFKQGKGE